MREKLAFLSLRSFLIVAVSSMAATCTTVAIISLTSGFWGRSTIVQIGGIVVSSMIITIVYSGLVFRFSLPHLKAAPQKNLINWIMVFGGSELLFLDLVSKGLVSLSQVVLANPSYFINNRLIQSSIWTNFLYLANAICISAVFFILSTVLIPSISARSQTGEKIFQSMPMLLILTANYFYLMGNFNHRLAIWNEDIGTILVPYYIKNPGLYANDLWMRLSWRIDLASLPTMITTFLYLVANIKPEIPAFILVYIQDIFVYFAVFRLAIVMTQKREIAWLSTFFAFSATPWSWNIAALGGLDTVVYSQNLALPFVINAASYFLENRFGRSMFFLGGAGLIHPSLALEMAAMLGLHLVWQTWKAGISRVLLKQWLILILVALASILPALLLNWRILQVPYEDAMSVIRTAGHLVSWDWSLGCDYCNVGFYKGIQIIPLFIVIALSALKVLPNRKIVGLFLKVVFTATIMMCLAHVLSIYLDIAVIARMALTRSTLLLITFFLPVFIYSLWESFSTSNYPTRLVILMCFLTPSIVSFLALTLILGTKYIKTQSSYIRLAYFLQIAAYSIVVLWILTYLSVIDIPQLKQIFNSPIFRSGNYTLNIYRGNIFWIIAIIGLVPPLKRICQHLLNRDTDGIVRKTLHAATQLFSTGSYLSLTSVILLAIMISSELFYNIRSGNSISSNIYKCNFETQIWARDNTDASAKFILHFSPGQYPLLYTWRTLTGRSLVQYYSGVGLYLTDQEVQRYGEELIDFYASYFNLPADHRYGYNKFPYVEYFSKLDAEGFRKFSKRFGGDYIVQLIESKTLDLPVAYKSDCMIIYQINRPPESTK